MKIEVVYFVQQGADGPIKIGRTRNLVNRLDHMANCNSCELIVQAIIPGNRELEAGLHGRFSKHHIRGEWFQPHRDVVDYIASLPDVLLRDLKFRRKYRKGLSKEDAAKVWADPALTSAQARAMIGWHPKRIADELGSKRPVSHQGRSSADNGRNFKGTKFTPAQRKAAKAIWRDTVEYDTWKKARDALAEIRSANGEKFTTDRARRLWKARKSRS